MSDHIIQLKPLVVSIEKVLREAGYEPSGGSSGKGATFWSTFELCPYDARLSELYGNEEVGTSQKALLIGILVHEGLAQWYLTRDKTQALKPIEIAIAWAQPNLTSEVADFAKTLWNCAYEARQIVSMAVDRVESPLPNTTTNLVDPYYDFNRSSVRSIEYLLEYTKDFHYSGRVDMVLEATDVDGSPCTILVDHKTVGEYTADWIDSFRQDLQFMGLPFLWNELMVPEGLPPCRYIIVAGYIKNPSKPSERFVKHIYPVYDNKLNAFYIQMQHNWELYTQCLEREEKALEESKTIDLATIWPQRYAACQSRRYGRKSANVYASHSGEFVHGGGRCRRFNYCLQLDMQTRLYTPPCNIEKPAIESPQLAGPPTSSSEPSSSTDPLAGNTQTAGELCEGPRHPIPDDESYVVSIGNIRDTKLLRDIPVGECVYLANGAAIFWTTGALDQDGNTLLLRPGCPTPLEYNGDLTAYVVDPIFKYPKGKEPQEPQVEPEQEKVEPPPVESQKVSAEPQSAPDADADEAPSNGAGKEPGSVGSVVGQAAMVGVGVVDVLYLGSFTRGGKALFPTMDKLWDERTAPFFGAVMIGRDVEKRKLQILSATDKGTYDKVHKRSVGEVIWADIVNNIQEVTA